MEAKPVNWKVAADRRTIGERVELKTLPGFWVQPRRISSRGRAEIVACQTRALGQARGDAVREVAANFSSQSDDGSSDVALTRDIAVRIMEGATAEMVGRVEERRALVFYGIHAHNLQGEPAAMSYEIIDELLETDEAIFNEIIRVVEEKNRPLAPTTSGQSETSPTSSTTEESPATESTPTEPIPPESS
jgi:hypothetical protein